MKRIILVSLFEMMNVLSQVVTFILWGFFFGAQAEMDAFLASAALPMVLGTVIVGPLIYSIVPLLAEAKALRSNLELRHLNSDLINLFALGGTLLALPIIPLAGPIMSLLTPGLHPELRALASGLLRIEAFSIPLTLVCGVLVSFYYVEEKYYWPTIVPLFGSIASLALLVLCHGRLGIQVLAWGMLLNTFVQAILMMRVCRNHSWRLNWQDKGLRKLARRMLPLCGGSVYFKSESLINRFLLSFLPVGSISYMGYSDRMLSSASQILARGLVTTRFGRLSGQYTRDQEDFKERVHHLFIQACLVAAPIVVCVALFIQTFLHLLMERGKFGALDVEKTAAVTVALLGLFVGGLLGSVTSSAMYAMGETRVATLVGMAAFTVGIALKVAGVALFSYMGLALATSIYYLLAVLFMMLALQKKLKIFSWQRTGSQMLKILVAACGTFAAAMAFQRVFAGETLTAFAGVALVFVVYLLLSLALGTVRRNDLRSFVPRSEGREA